jgi:leucyl-tRNA synthetase
MKRYNHTAIEKKWQKEWEKKKVYRTESDSKKKKQYVLDMFPYPSGAGLHVGHPKGYIGSDVYARMKRMQGFNVLHPMGYDAFGLPAEQYAITHKIHPRKAVLENVKTFERQLSIIGLGYDWDRKVNTTDPEYYRWTQWIFLQIYNSWYDVSKDKAQPIDALKKRFAKEGNSKVQAVCDENTPVFTAQEWKAKNAKEQQDILMKYRLAYEGKAEVNWCPGLGTVLANDEVVDGPDGKPVSERGGYPVEKKQMRQWFMRITAYADRLLSGLDTVQWSPNIKEIQRNWIGKSEGAEISFSVCSKRNVNLGEKITVFTTRADTLFGATYVVLAPEHPLVETLSSHIENIGEVLEYKTAAQNTATEVRTDGTKAKTGVLLKGVAAVNPVNGEVVPVWIADYVLASYGTGAVMAVPAHDERDFEFAQKYNLPIRSVIDSHNSVLEKAYTEEGVLHDCGEFSGMTSAHAKKAITEKVGGKIVAKYKMRNAIFARQRYWGEPIPLWTDKDGIIHEVDEKKLPLTLPDVKSYEPTGTGESPLASVSLWTKKGFETNTMPGWAGSSWYFLRYMDPKNKKEIASKKALSYWGQVDTYVGGAEHATGHLLYSRFWNKFLKDIGVVKHEEPFKVLRNQGMIGGEDGRKMSKRWGNVINPNDVVATYGADTFRIYEMFMGPFEAGLPWNTENIIGSRRFVERVWRLGQSIVSSHESKGKKGKTNPELETVLHKTIQKVTSDIENFSHNTAVSALMIALNEMEKVGGSQEPHVDRKDFEMFLKVLHPFAPHMTEELWKDLGNKDTLVKEVWPKADPRKMKTSTVIIVVQVNGKMRGEIKIDADSEESEVLAKVKNDSQIQKWIGDSVVKKVIFVKNRLINMVI